MRTALRAAVTAAALTLALLPAQADPANLVVNGGFEDGFSTYASNANLGYGPVGWTVTTTHAGYDAGVKLNGITGTGPASHSGNWGYWFGEGSKAEMGSIRQDLATTAGTWYYLTFWAAAHDNNGSPTNPGEIMPNGLHVYWDGVEVVGMQLSSIDWTKYTYLVQAQDASTTLKVAGWNSPGGNKIDDISVAAVPEASSLMLLLPGLAPLATALRRRRAR